MVCQYIVLREEMQELFLFQEEIKKVLNKQEINVSYQRGRFSKSRKINVLPVHAYYRNVEITNR